MEIPIKVRKQLDSIYEATDNMNYIVDYRGVYLPKTGDIFRIRHYHHIDQNRKNNEIWNLVPLSYQDHVIEIHSKNNKEVKKHIYYFMIQRYPEYEYHYQKYLLQ